LTTLSLSLSPFPSPARPAAQSAPSLKLWSVPPGGGPAVEGCPAGAGRAQGLATQGWRPGLRYCAPSGAMARYGAGSATYSTNLGLGTPGASVLDLAKLMLQYFVIDNQIIYGILSFEVDPWKRPGRPIQNLQKWFHVLRWREAYRRGSTGLNIFKMEGHPRMLLKIKDDRKFSWGYPRILFKIKCLAVLTHYLTENKWLDNTHWETAA